MAWWPLPAERRAVRLLGGRGETATRLEAVDADEARPG